MLLDLKRAGFLMNQLNGQQVLGPRFHCRRRDYLAVRYLGKSLGNGLCKLDLVILLVLGILLGKSVSTHN
jgi:hypothetical protein